MRENKGGALITALILVTLSTTLVSSLFSEQLIQLRFLENKRNQVQTFWVLKGAFDWAKLILMEDLKFTNIDTLDEPWNTPLKATKLNNFLTKNDIQNNSYTAILSGQIIDEQGKYNLNRIIKNQKINNKELKIFEKILMKLEIPGILAKRTADALLRKSESRNSELGFFHLSDLIVIGGFTKKNINILENYTTFLPYETKININTANEITLQSFLGITETQSRDLIKMRNEAYFISENDLKIRASLIGVEINFKDSTISTKYFKINGIVKINHAEQNVEMLINRTKNGINTLWLRPN